MGIMIKSKTLKAIITNGRVTKSNIEKKTIILFLCSGFMCFGSLRIVTGLSLRFLVFYLIRPITSWNGRLVKTRTCLIEDGQKFVGLIGKCLEHEKFKEFIFR